MAAKGTIRINTSRMDRGFMVMGICSVANLFIWENPQIVLRLMLVMASTTVTTEAVKTARNFPVEMSSLETGVTKSVSKVPLSFSPAVRSMAGYMAPIIAKITIM